MSARLDISINIVGLPTVFTDAVAMAQIGNAVKILIVRRTQRGTDANGRAFLGYATNPIWISTGTGRPLAPKGGTLSRTGKTMRFDGGYKEYKERSRGPGQRPSVSTPAASTSEVDLLLTGDLMRSIKVTETTAETVTVAAGVGMATEYADPVNDRREFMGIAPDDVPLLEAEATEAIRGAMRRLYGAP